MAGGGKNGELMKVKASGGGETLHAATGATFSSVASTSCQETQLIGLEKLGVGGAERGGGRQGGCGIWRNSAAGAFWTPLVRLATTAEQTNTHSIGSVGFLREEIIIIKNNTRVCQDAAGSETNRNKPTNHLKRVGVALSPGGGSAGGAVEPPGVSTRYKSHGVR